MCKFSNQYTIEKTLLNDTKDFDATVLLIVLFTGARAVPA